MVDVANSGKCDKCGSKRIKEVITGGMKQIVHWDEEYVVGEETTYENPIDIRHIPVKIVELPCKL
ncbi:MAG: hypothetical protein M0Z77_10755 [Thermoplasmatales archaeon]|nr:hypothetical protein [Thermoplasmatales archaeon]